MTLTTLTTLPPEILQSFNRWLLNPWAGAMEDWQKEKTKILKKHQHNKGILREFERLFKLLEEMNEWYQAKEAYKRAENKDSAKKPVLQVSEEPMFPYALRVVFDKFSRNIRQS